MPPQRMTDFSGNTYTNATQNDRFLTSDMSMLKMNPPNAFSADKDLQYKQNYKKKGFPQQ